MDQAVFFQKLVAFTTAVHQVKHELTRDLKPDDITPVQYSILESVAVHQPVTLSDISDCQHMSMPNTSREIRKLTEKNLCEKSAVAEDLRKQSVRLTPAGQALMDEAFARIEERFLRRIQGDNEEDLEMIERAIDVLQAKLFYTD